LSTIAVPALLFTAALGSAADAWAERTFGKGGHVSPDHYPGWTLAWRDEFGGGSLDAAYWSQQSGLPEDARFRRQLQKFQAPNVSVEGGFLVLTASASSQADGSFTAARVSTQGKRTFRHGRIDIRALVPDGAGLWSAFRLQGSGSADQGWQRAGELTISEVAGGTGRNDTVQCGIHWKQGGAYRFENASMTLPSGNFSQQFHVFSIIWSDTGVRWLVDGFEFSRLDLSDEGFSAFHEDFDLLVELAVGGDWPGPPGDASGFPQRMAVDYIRYFQPQQKQALHK
jgi:beta-glucanase (GH16 family)